MSKNPVSKSKPVKRNEPMHNALKFFLAGCVAEIYLLVIRRFYVNGTANELLACDAALPYLMAAGAAVAVIGLVLGIVWRQQTKRRWIGWAGFSARGAPGPRGGQYGRYQIGIACVHQRFDRGVIRFRDEPAFVFHAVTSDLYGKSAADTNSI